MNGKLVRLLLGAIILMANIESLSAQTDQEARSLLLDAALHYAISTEISFASCMFFTLKNQDMPLGKKYLLSSGVGMFAGFTKEFIDMVDNYFDWADIGVDMLGVGTGILLHYLVFDRKMKHSHVSFNLSGECYMTAVRFYF